jgi:8-oxo-dGTP pyrophosphatase MutT (NUDIX family)
MRLYEPSEFLTKYSEYPPGLPHRDEKGSVEQRREPEGRWRCCVQETLPGGAIDLGESVAQAAVRETREETGIPCEVTGISGIYSDPRHAILYTSDREARQEFSVVLTARALSGQPTPSSESREVRWVPK